MDSVIFFAITIVALGFLEYVDLKKKLEEPFQNGKLNRRKRQANEDDPNDLEVLLQNIFLIEEHNKMFNEGEVSFKLKLNKFARMDPLRFSQSRNGLKLDVPEFLQDFVEGALKFVSPLVQVLSKVNLACIFVDCSVKDQLDCASCWAFSALGAVEGQIFKQTGQQVSLSEQNLIDCAGEDYGNNGCEGGLIEGAYNYLSEHGVNTALEYPYEGKDGNCRHNGAGSVAGISHFRRIQKGNETQLMEAVATVGAISAAMDSSLPTFQFYSQGIYFDPLCSSTELNHGVVVVGYGTTLAGDDYWVVKNSYGNDWGEGGYFKLARNRDNHCGIATSSTYPVL